MTDASSPRTARGTRTVLWLSVGLSLLAFSTALAVAVNTEGGPLSDGPRVSDLDQRLRRLEERFGRVEAIVGPTRFAPLDEDGGVGAPPRSRLDLRISLLEQQLAELEDRLTTDDPARQRLERLLREERVRELRAEREAAAEEVRATVLDAERSADERVEAYRRLVEARVPPTEPVHRAMLGLFDAQGDPVARERLALAFAGVRDRATLAALHERMEAAEHERVAKALRGVLETAELLEESD